MGYPALATAQQETATIIGTITDAQRAALPGATVTAKNIETGFVRTGVSDSEGRYPDRRDSARRLRDLGRTPGLRPLACAAAST